MRIKLKRLSLVNFKGVRQQDITLDDETNIFGDNGTGKTTIFDAFLWLLFGKDSTGRQAFEIKTLDENNKPYHRMEHEVSAVFEIDGEEIHLRKSFREKWTTKRGSSQEIWDGHENLFFWNDVPMKEGEYKAKIASLLDENVFRLITNPAYFNSLDWKERRNILLAMAGHISTDQILDKVMTVQNKGEYGILINALNSKKTLDEFAREIGAKKKKIKDEIVLMPARIDESKRSLPEKRDYTAIEMEIASLQESIVNIDNLLMNKTQGQKQRQAEKMKFITRRGDLKQELVQIGFNIKNELQNAKLARQQGIEEAKRSLRQKQDKLSSILSDIATNGRTVEAIRTRQNQLRDDYNTKQAEIIKFDDKEFCCPTCKRTYEDADVFAKKDELTRNFNTVKSNRLAAIQAEGKQLGAEAIALETKTTELSSTKTLLEGEVKTILQEISGMEELHSYLSEKEAAQVDDRLATDIRSKEITAEIDRLAELIDTPEAQDNNTDLLQQKSQIATTLEEAKKALNERDQRDRTNKRIAELEQQHKDMAQEVATLESTELCIQEFTKAKMDLLENRINGRFELVKFRLFKDQINGGEVPSCDTLINGVPYSDANYASKVNAGLDIIRALSEHYGVWAPIFIDNRESTIRIIDTGCQIINLRAVGGAELSIGQIKYKRGYKPAEAVNA